MTPETILMWSAAIILAALALTAATFALWWASTVGHGALNRWRIRGLTRDQIAECRALAARFRTQNMTSTGTEETQ